jgi:hypothetical protein
MMADKKVPLSSEEWKTVEVAMGLRAFISLWLEDAVAWT